ncbi:MAG: hypothetical protein ABI877_21270 [Gemmatimonadaceae bacterium]
MPIFHALVADRGPHSARRALAPLSESLSRDVRFAFERSVALLPRRPLPIVIAGLGIGGSTKVFSIAQYTGFADFYLASPMPAPRRQLRLASVERIGERSGA